MSVRLVVASGNRHKVVELAAMLQAAPQAVEVLGLSSFPDAPEVPETADTFVGNAALKAQGIADYLRARGEAGDTLVLADDSGLAVEALEGAPGVYSARFSGPAATDASNNEKLVAELQARDLTLSAAHYACILALCRVDGAAFGGRDLHTFEGRWDVVVRTSSRGEGGFGYDPHAWLLDADTTVAELSRDEKATRSHRGVALRALLAGWPLGT